MNTFKTTLLSGLGLLTLNIAGIAFAGTNTGDDCPHKMQANAHHTSSQVIPKPPLPPQSQILQRHQQGDKYQAMQNQIVPLFKADGYLATANSKVEMEFLGNDIFINGQRIGAAQKARYVNVLESTLGKQSKTKRIAIQGNHLEVENTSLDEKNHTRYTSDTQSKTTTY